MLKMEASGRRGGRGGREGGREGGRDNIGVVVVGFCIIYVLGSSLNRRSAPPREGRHIKRGGLEEIKMRRVRNQERREGENREKDRDTEKERERGRGEEIVRERNTERQNRREKRKR